MTKDEHRMLFLLQSIAFSADRVVELSENQKEGTEAWRRVMQELTDALNLFGYEFGGKPAESADHLRLVL